MQPKTILKLAKGSHWKGISKRKTEIKAEPKKRYNTDKVFDLCLLLITVIAGAELGYSGSSNQLEVTKSIFHWTTIPLLILIPLWIFLMLLPIETIKFRGFEKHFSRRFLKEFCWAFFGNIFAVEIVTFFALSTNQTLTSGVTSLIFLSALFLYALTFYAVLQYQFEDQRNAPIVEVDKAIYRLTFFLLFVIEIIILGFLIALKLLNITIYVIVIALIIATINGWIYSFNSDKKSLNQTTKDKTLKRKGFFFVKILRFAVLPSLEYSIIYFISYVFMTIIILQSFYS